MWIWSDLIRSDLILCTFRTALIRQSCHVCLIWSDLMCCTLQNLSIVTLRLICLMWNVELHVLCLMIALLVTAWSYLTWCDMLRSSHFFQSSLFCQSLHLIWSVAIPTDQCQSVRFQSLRWQCMYKVPTMMYWILSASCPTRSRVSILALTAFLQSACKKNVDPCFCLNCSRSRTSMRLTIHVCTIHCKKGDSKVNDGDPSERLQKTKFALART